MIFEFHHCRWSSVQGWTVLNKYVSFLKSCFYYLATAGMPLHKKISNLLYLRYWHESLIIIYWIIALKLSLYKWLKFSIIEFFSSLLQLRIILLTLVYITYYRFRCVSLNMNLSLLKIINENVYPQV